MLAWTALASCSCCCCGTPFAAPIIMTAAGLKPSPPLVVAAVAMPSVPKMVLTIPAGVVIIDDGEVVVVPTVGPLGEFCDVFVVVVVMVIVEVFPILLVEARRGDESSKPSVFSISFSIRFSCCCCPLPSPFSSCPVAPASAPTVDDDGNFPPQIDGSAAVADDEPLPAKGNG